MRSYDSSRLNNRNHLLVVESCKRIDLVKLEVVVMEVEMVVEEWWWWKW